MIGDGVKKIPNTFGVDVSAASFFEYGSEDELCEGIVAGSITMPYLHIGSGSNLLFICLLYTSPSPRD